MADTLTDFYIAEGIRQDKLIHDLASVFVTKAGFYMVVSGFVFSSSAILLQNSTTQGFAAWKPTLVLAMLFALTGVLMLLRTVFLREYSMPPLLSSMRIQAQNQTASQPNLSDADTLAAVKEGIIECFAETISQNDAANSSVAESLKNAASMIAISIVLVFLSVLAGIMHSASSAHS
jgi:hypothetical protein